MSLFQNLFANLTLSKTLKGLFCILSSLSLTAYIDLYTLNSVWSRLLVFGCFIVAWGILLWIVSRFFKTVLSPRVVFPVICTALLILLGFWNAFFPSAQETCISLTSETAGEICLCDVVVDGESIPVAKAEVVENTGWVYGKQYDNFRIWSEEDGVENCLTLRFFAEEVCLGFPYTPYAGTVTIASSAGDGGGTWDLRCPEWEEGEEVEYASFPVDCRRVYTPLECFLCGTGIFTALIGLCLMMVFVWMKFWLRLNPPQEENECSEWEFLLGKIRWNISRYASPQDIGLRLLFFINLLVIYYMLFFSSAKVAPDRSTAIFLFLLTAVSYLCLFSSLLEGYKTRRGIAFVMLMSLYASFASFGQRFFLDGNTRMHFSADGLFHIVLGTVWFVPVICLLLYVLELLSSRCRPRTESHCRRRVFWGLLVLLCLCQAVILWNFWPGSFPADCIVLMDQAVGNVPINNWHPALNAIIYRAILTICPHAGALVAVQLFFFALLVTEFLMLGYDHGVSFKILAVLGAAVSLLPNQVLFSISPVKDYPYTLALLWITYLLVRLILEPKELWKWRFLAALSLSLFLVYGFRHNGIMPFTALLLLFGWITWRHFPRVKFKLAEAGLAAVLLVITYKGPIFSLFQVSQDLSMSSYTTMLCAVASCINKDLPLSEESNAIMESILPLDQWADYYDRYWGYDMYYWRRGEENETAYPFDPSQVTAKEAFTVYLEALQKYPDVVIKDRLDGTDLLWDVQQPTDSYNIKGFYGTAIAETDHVSEYFEFGSMEPGVNYYNQSDLADFYLRKMYIPENNVFDMLLWRAGVYLILLMALGLFWWKNQMKTLFSAAVPLLGQLVGLVLVLYHQSYRYISAVQSLTLALVFCSVCLRGAQTAKAYSQLETEKPSSENREANKTERN